MTPVEISNNRARVQAATTPVDIRWNTAPNIIREMQRLIDEYPGCTITIHIDINNYFNEIDQYAVISRPETDQEVKDRVTKQQEQLRERLAREIEEKQRQLADLQRWV